METKPTISFENPPIEEVSYNIQFDPIPEFHLGLVGLLWGEFREQFPVVEFDNPLNSVQEKFGLVRPSPPTLGIELIRGVRIPRFRMITPDNCTLLQVQNGNFVFNWRRQNDASVEYPRFAALKESFTSYLRKFESFFESQSLASPRYNLIEITNLNHIPVNGKDFSEVFQGLECGRDLAPNLQLEALQFQLKQKILSDTEHKPLGRLYTKIEKAQIIEDGTEIYKISLTARAHPVDNSIDTVLETMELLRNCINISFVGFTRKEMHREWGIE